MSEQEKLLTYYQRQLSYLRNAGTQFARTHPKVARRLEELGPNEAGVPHVERLIQSFAYLNARLQKSIDDYFPLISAGFARRNKSERADITMTDLFLTFVAYNFDPKAPEAETIYACKENLIPLHFGMEVFLEVY